MPKLNLPLLDSKTAPSSVSATLANVEKKYGLVPNLYRIFANAPIALDAYLAISDAFQRGTLSATERNIVLLAASRENGCGYCVAAHSAVADMQKDPPHYTEAIRNGVPLDDRKLEALRQLTQAVVRGRGRPEASIVQAFIDAGYQPHHVLEVLVGVTMKTLSNYTNHLAKTPLDSAFAGREWQPEA
ncbi:MAG: carboxymuconolactone decarboxylase family protein [Deltaproteobacteria bacterium]|nr:carboxymuconolactone decarboxylase family protein [Deltaproteobacteria bacterium]